MGAPVAADCGTVAWANADVDEGRAPAMVTATPGPRSVELHGRMARRNRTTLTSMVRLHPVAYERGCGVVLDDVDGNRYLDFSSGIVVANLGHAHPRVARAIADAAHKLCNVHDFTHPAKVEAADALCAQLPGPLGTVAFLSAGTEAVECALRVARAATGRPAFAGVWGDYHGRTGGAASVSSLRSGNAPRDPGTLLLAPGDPGRSPVPEGEALALARRTLEAHGVDQLAGVVVEPVTNATGGIVAPPAWLAGLVELVRGAGGLYIADEVACGMGRAGAWSASVDAGVVPDVLVLGKGLGNGFPLSAVVVRDDLADALGRAYPSTTYGGNPMAMAALVTVVRTIHDEGILPHVRKLGEHALGRLREIADRQPDGVVEVRGQGALLALEVASDRLGDEVVRQCFRRGLALTSRGAVVRITPPIVTSASTFDVGAELLADAIDAACEAVAA